MTEETDGGRVDRPVGRWIATSERMPEDGQSVAFVVKASRRLDYMDGKVLGGTYRAGPCGGFGVPGLIVDAHYWMPLPPAPNAALSGRCEREDSV